MKSRIVFPILIYDGLRIYDYLQGVFIWFSPGFHYFSVISNANPSREKKTRFSIVWQEKSYMEGNQGRLFQIKTKEAISMLGDTPSGAPERKTANHTSACARMSGRTRRQGLPLIYRGNFREGTWRIGDT